MVLHCAGDAATDLSVSARHRETLARQAAALKLDTILAGLDVLSATKARLRGSNHGRVLLEMALVRLGRLDDLVSLAQVAHWLGGGERRAAGAGPPEAVKKKPPNGAEGPAGLQALPRGPVPLSEQSLPAVWGDLLAQVGPMAAAHLGKAGPPAISGPNSLVLRFPARYNQERDYCQEPTRAQRIEELLRKITGQPCQLRIESVGSGAVLAPEEAAEDGVNSPPRSRLKRADAVQEPLLKRAIDVLGAQVVHVDDGFGAAPAAGAPAPDAEEM
jgi:DNA polymerase-3 subunit gamma/tau